MTGRARPVAAGGRRGLRLDGHGADLRLPGDRRRPHDRRSAAAASSPRSTSAATSEPEQRERTERGSERHRARRASRRDAAQRGAAPAAAGRRAGGASGPSCRRSRRTPPCRLATSSPHDRKRSAGSFASPRSKTASIAGGSERSKPRRRRDRRRRVRGGLGRERLRQVRPAAAEQLERDDGEPVAVARRGRRAADGLLGRHVARRAEDRADARQRDVARDPRDPEVGHAHLAVAAEHQVRRLDVAMDDARGVRRVERPPRLLEPREGERGRDRGPRASGRRAFRPGRNSITIAGRPSTSATSKIVTTFGSFESRAAIRASRVNRARISGSPANRSLEDLDRDPPVERVVGRDVDVRHAAGRDQLGPAVARRERERGCGHPPRYPRRRRRETDRALASGWQRGHQ